MQPDLKYQYACFNGGQVICTQSQVLVIVEGIIRIIIIIFGVRFGFSAQAT